MCSSVPGYIAEGERRKGFFFPLCNVHSCAFNKATGKTSPACFYPVTSSSQEINQCPSKTEFVIK